MIVAELFASLDRDAVIRELERQSPRQVANRKGHIEAWNEIVGLKPLPTEYTCRVDLVQRGAERSYIDVSGVAESSEDLLAIEFVDWLSMRVVLGSGVADVQPVAVLAAILNEMTFAGYSNLEATGN